jgi:DNA-binding CsgD family transcriptional regulator
MPKNARYTLAWSPLHQAYKLHESQDSGVLDIVPESPAWFAWVSQVSSFAFHGRNGSYTACKECKQRGEGYWYAYARVEGKLTKGYLGRGIGLTLTRLEQAAQELWLDTPAARLQKEGTAASRLLPSPPITQREKAFLPELLSEAHTLSSADAKQRHFRFDQRSRVSHASGVGGRKPAIEHAEAAALSRSSYPLVPLTSNTAVPPAAARRSHYPARRPGGSPADRKTRPALAHPPADPLLATKLHVPRPRPHLVHRPRLIQRLQQGMERALILISVPVGFGKTTLLSDWLASRAIPVAWLSLEPQDNEPARFLSYLLAALQTYDPHLGTIRQVQHHPLRPPSIETILTVLINDLLVRRATAQEHFVLVLDNYQFVTDESIHRALSFLLEHLPPCMHLVLATREDPPLPLAQLRGRDDLLELRATDLRFTQEEAATFLIEVMGLPLSTGASALLQARTEGWITGLQLAAFSLQGRDDPEAFITAFSGSHHYVVDYLLEEVLNRQSEDIQNFLLQTCILDRLSAPLCDAVREQHGSQALLDFLERANLFLVALDEQGQWYRYHRLFAEALRQWLQQTAPALVPVLHLRASRWYEQHGLFAEAVSHAPAASDPQPGSLVEPLTGREREVLQLLLDGASNREIARHLVLSMNTVKKHVLNICGKLNVRSRAQVIAKARTPHLL